VAITVDCPHCGEKLHVKEEFAGRKGKCPKCRESFQVPTRGHEGNGSRSAAPPQPALRSEDARQQVLDAFRGNIAPPRVSFIRKLAMLVVAIFVCILPLFYVAALVAVVLGMIWLATSESGAQFHPALFWIVQISGGLILICLLKPFVEPRRKMVETYPLSSGKEPFLVEFVGRICEQLNAAPPTLIQTECSTRLAAEYRRGMLGLVQRDTVLTIGLPLIASLSAEQLAGLMACQMAQFRRHAGCRTMNFIRSINGWLWRSVFEDGRFDAWLARVAARPHFHWAKLLLPLWGARIVAQAVLFVPMFLGNTVASSLVRKAELDADRAAARLVGRETFASLLTHLGVIEFTWQGVLAELEFLHGEQQLPDSLPRQLALRMLDVTPELSAALHDGIANPEQKPFDSRPNEAERLQAVSGESAEAVFSCPAPARAILADFEGMARQMTWDYYVGMFGPQRLKHALKAVELPA
jgi:hypothetical protein